MLLYFKNGQNYLSHWKQLTLIMEFGRRFDAMDLECEASKMEKGRKLSGIFKRPAAKPAESPASTQELNRTAMSSRNRKPTMKGSQVNDGSVPEGREDEREESPVVPPRPTEEELKTTVSYSQQNENMINTDQVDDECFERQKYCSTKAGDKEGAEESLTHTHMEKTKKTTKPRNPFMPRLGAKGKLPLKKKEDHQGAKNKDPTETAGEKKSLYDLLDELHLERSEKEDNSVQDLMEWWNTVEQWEDLPHDGAMTEKEEAKAFAVTAEKVQKGIRVFNKLFSERAESLWQHVIDLQGIANGLDQFNKRTKIAQITGGSTSAVGGVTTIAGLALAPVTFGTSLIVTAVGIGVVTAGGLTAASAGISNTVNNSLDRKKVERIVRDYQEKISDINNCMKFIKQGVENLRKFNLVKMKSQDYSRDFPGLGNIYEDGLMAGKAILLNANEIMRVVQSAHVVGTTAARAVQVASMATGVLSGLFVGMDIYFVAKDSMELKKGAKSEFAAKIREVAQQLHDGLVELNGIRDELKGTNALNSSRDLTDISTHSADSTQTAPTPSNSETTPTPSNSETTPTPSNSETTPAINNI